MQGKPWAPEILLNLIRQLTVIRTVANNRGRLIPLPPIKYALPVKVIYIFYKSMQDIIIPQY